jgi:hypothetical protein
MAWVEAQSDAQIQYFPQFVIGGEATTLFIVHNTSSGEITVTVDLFLSDGSSLWTQEFQLLAGATETVVPDLALSEVTAGWARVTATGSFSVTELWQFTDASGELINQVGVAPSPTTTSLRLFAFIRQESEAKTGIAVANPSNTEESVLSVRRLSPEGEPLEERTILLGPLKHSVSFLDEDPYFSELTNFEGTVEIVATAPIAAVAARLDGGQLATLSAVAVVVSTAGLLSGPACEFPPVPAACNPCKVFVTSTVHDGNLGGLAGADAICNSLASDAGLPGTYKAWLSDGFNSPSMLWIRIPRTLCPSIRTA